MESPEKSREWTDRSMNLQPGRVIGTGGSVPDRRTGDEIDPPSAIAIFVAAIFLLLAAYTLVFAVTMPQPLGRALGIAASNVVPLAVISAAAYAGLRNWVLPGSVLLQASCHLVLAPTFALLWYGLIILIQSLMLLAARGTFELITFSAIALVWQLFQGLVLYALVAAITYALRGGRTAAPVQLITPGEPMERYLTRLGDELIPIEVEDIVLIRGAQDYAEVVTATGKAHLVRMSLGEFEQRLPRSQFLRVHRSIIVNLRHMGRAEPVGSGRLALHLAGGQTVETSRSGAQLIRQKVI